MTPIEKIKSLINNLPSKDVVLANKFIDNHNYDSLYELVDSSITRVEKNLESSNPKEEYENIDIDSLIDLRYEISNYLNLLYPDDIKSYEEY